MHATSPPPPRAAWQLRLLGGFAIDDGRQRLTRLHSRAAVLLLARLALRPGRDHGREELAALLWPEADAATGLARLRQTLSTLRATLERSAGLGDARPLFAADRRVLVGGRDEPFYSPGKRDKLLHQKTRLLMQDFDKRFPTLAPLLVDFNWAGTFAETADGLPFIGSVKERPRTAFALGFGGNGIVFSQIAAEIIRDTALGKKHPDAHIFAFNRAKTT